MSVNALQAHPLIAVSATEREARWRCAVDDYYLFVWRTLRRLGIPKDEAEDLAQEVFVIFSRKFDSVAPGLERPFLFQCAANLAMHARRAFQRRRTLEERAAMLEAPELMLPSVEDDAERQQDIALLDTLLAELPEELRAIVVLCELEEMTVAEAAEILGLRPGTAASRLRRAREELSAAMARLKRKTR
jgi:RNA polymerase sigma-70 factor (ECF subfamily)